MTSYEPQRPSTSNLAGKEPINLLRGWPHPSLLPTDLIRSAAQHALSDRSISTPGLLYGPDAGYQPLRDSIAEWLTSFYCEGKEDTDTVTADRICITGGASQNLGSILNVYTDPSYTRCVWVVAPAYFLAFRIFEDDGLEMRAVPEDKEGVNIEYLRAEIEKVEHNVRHERQKRKFKPDRPWAKTYKHIIYCVPTFANPSGKTTTLQRRKALVELAREYDALVVCDDVYDFLQWPATTSLATNTTLRQRAHLPRLVDLDRTLPYPSCSPPADVFGNVCSNGSLSKIAGPGIRVGWCEGTSKFAYGISQVGTTKSGGAPSQLTSTYIAILLEKGQLQQHIQRVLLPAYQRRYTHFMKAMETHLFPIGFRLPSYNTAIDDVAGGYFAWLSLPFKLRMRREDLLLRSSSPAEKLAERCLMEENVIIAPGKIFEVPGDTMVPPLGVNFSNCIRLCWSWEDEDKLAEGVERVARVARAMVREVETAVEVDGEHGYREGYVFVEKVDEQRRG